MPEYDFLNNIPMDEGHTLEQLTGRFQGVKDGLPELPKNSKDQYFRLQVAERDHRQIVIIGNSNLRSIAVLDFAGASQADFDGWMKWSSRTAARAESSGDIEGGHGNGGKAFMVRGSTGESYMESVFEGKRTRMAFKNDDPSKAYRPAYSLENGKRVQGITEADCLGRLKSDLAGIELDYEQLPAPARAAFEARNAFTIIHIGGVKEWANRRTSTIRTLLRELHTDLTEHAQIAMTLDSCNVWVVSDGQPCPGEPLAPQYPDPFAGFENLPRIELPAKLVDPQGSAVVGIDTGGGYLELRTSHESLRRSDRRKAMNVIRVRNTRNIVGNWSVADLAPRPESTFIYGTVFVPALGAEHQIGAERRDVADVPLVRAVRAWVADQVNDLAARIQQSQVKHHRPEDRNRANDALEKLRNLMRKFLEPESGGGTPEREFGEVVTELILEGSRGEIAMAVGTSVPLQLAAYEVTASGKRLPVRRPAVEMIVDDPTLVAFSNGMLTAQQAGKTRIRMRLVGSNVESNTVEVELVRCIGVDIICPERTLLQGEQVKITNIFRTNQGTRDDLLIEGRTRQDFLIDGMVDEAEMGKLSRTGRFTAGSIEGEATIRVRFGPDQQDTSTATLVIGSQVVQPRDRPGRGEHNGDIPLILMCGATAPGMDELPPEQRTHSGGEYHPTIIMMEPPFDNVVWINMSSKEATRVRQERGGATGVDRIASRNSLQFLALKCFEVLKHLKVKQELHDSQATDVAFRQYLAQAEMDCADFVDAAFDLADQLHRESESH